MTARYHERLSTQDSSFIAFEGPGTHMHVSAVGLFEAGPLTHHGRLDFARLRAYVESRLHLLPRYRQRLVFTPLQRHPVWVDDRCFDLLYHVRHTALPAPGSDEQLKELVGRILSQQLDRAKPLWELWFVEGVEQDRFAMLAKVHHCMVDGISSVGVMTALLSASPAEQVAPPRPWRPRAEPGRLELLADEVLHRAAAPVSALRAVGGALQRPDRASSQVAQGAEAVWHALYSGLRRPVETPINRPIGTHRRVDWCTLELGVVKDVKKRLGGTVNDVVLAVVSGALRRFLRQRRFPLRGLDFRVVVPVNMRSGEESRDGNRVSAWFVSLPIAENDPARRLERIRDETERIRRSRTAEGIDLFTRFVEWTGSDLLTSWGVRFVSALRPYHMIVSNVPGPQFPLYVLGARLETMVPQLPLFEHQGLGVVVMSYLGRVSFGTIADRDAVPDVERFSQAIEESFHELERAAKTR